MKLKIAKDSAVKIALALAAVNGKSTEHTYRSFEQLATLADSAESQLAALGIPKKNRAGAKFCCTSSSALN